AFGYVISLGFFGIFLAQTFIYYTRFPGDSSRMKVYVWFVVLLECSSCALGLCAIWIGSEIHCLSCMVSSTYVPGDYAPGNVMARLLSPWSYTWMGLSVLTGLIASLVHGFFSWRIWVIGKSLYVPILVMAVRLYFNCHITPLITSGRYLLHNVRFLQLWLGGSFICDVIITFETTRWLLKNSHTGFRETHSLVMKLVKLTIETGMVTTVAILLELLLYRFLGPTAYLSVYFSISRLYANCLLATLNARLVISRDLTHVQQVSTVLFVVPNANSASESHGIPVRRRNTGRLSPSLDPDTWTPSPQVSNNSCCFTNLPRISPFCDSPLEMS
ncbi:hypothetical protein BV22DRAFT_1025068, partial [Leucogyrophana mollusca]